MGIAAHAQQVGRDLRDEIGLILVDAEMPEMDGYVLTKQHQGRPAFRGHAGGHAFVAVVGGQPGDGQARRVSMPTSPSSTPRRWPTPCGLLQSNA
ncbi:MAG: hypothetical protein MZW92_52230 [Comamonadaceae bacterium]|nr:hypothetical protein [Comamonadaceae bacterium]